jgi:hypothetical protein|tara:strand:+ start:164 stop:373 length:210 start_codon:yes stop_codon:yes gene_type:complete
MTVAEYKKCKKAHEMLDNFYWSLSSLTNEDGDTPSCIYSAIRGIKDASFEILEKYCYEELESCTDYVEP